MSKYFTISFLFLFIPSCGYPDLDNVPDFKDTKLTDEVLEKINIIHNNNPNPAP